MVLGTLRKRLRKRLVRWPECPKYGVWDTTAATVVKTSLKRGICVLSIFIAIIPTRLLCQMWANCPEVEFVRWPPRCKEMCKKMGWKSVMHVQSFACVLPAQFTPLGEILSLFPFPVNWIVYFSSGSRPSDRGERPRSRPSTLQGVLSQGKNYCSQGNDRGARNQKINLQKLPRVAEKG